MIDPGPRVSRLLVGAVVALALIATACGASSGEGTVETSAPAADAATAVPESQPEAQAEPAEASRIASTVSGGQIDFGALEGQDVVLWFWAPW